MQLEERPTSMLEDSLESILHIIDRAQGYLPRFKQVSPTCFVFRVGHQDIAADWLLIRVSEVGNHFMMNLNLDAQDIDMMWTDSLGKVMGKIKFIVEKWNEKGVEAFERWKSLTLERGDTHDTEKIEEVCGGDQEVPQEEVPLSGSTSAPESSN